MKTNRDLVVHAHKALNEKWGYVWGTFGQILTPSLYEQKLRQYPKGVGNYSSFIKKNWMNRRTADCVGLIKSCVWWSGNGPRYNSKQDVNADGMYKMATVKGSINTLPERPGVCLWRKGHIGVYIGNGQVIEARGTKHGVVKTPLKGVGANKWTHWLECPFIKYTNVRPTNKPKEEIKMNKTENLANWQKVMGTQSVKSMASKGYVNDPDKWLETLGEETPQYLFWSILDRITEEE